MKYIYFVIFILSSHLLINAFWHEKAHNLKEKVKKVEKKVEAKIDKKINNVFKTRSPTSVTSSTLNTKTLVLHESKDEMEEIGEEVSLCFLCFHYVYFNLDLFIGRDC